MEFFSHKKFFLPAVILLFLFFAFFAHAANVGDVVNFNVDKSFDATARNQVQATLIKITNNIYFYIEKNWWDSQPIAKQNEIIALINILSQEFEGHIYPILTSVFGTEWRPGVDGDSRLTIFFEAINSNEGGYFREADEYIKLQMPNSNEKEMVYLSLDRIEDPRLKVFLAHEFMHLITFNQKNEILGVSEDTWLNEARADYTSTILGYDDKYESSNLQQRVKDFIENPSDSITEWLGTKYDYASCSLFMHYLVDHYSINILIDSLKSKYSGIDSINYALQKNNYKEDFGQIFTDWTIASVLNDCSISQKYCYLNQNLTNFRLSPAINFLPLTGNVSLSVTNVAKSWQGNWLKFIGGNGDLKLDFSSLKGLNFEVPYILQDSAGSYAVKFLTLDQNEKGEISVPKFGQDYKSLIIIPSLQLPIYQPEGTEPTYPFTYSVEVAGSAPVGNQELIQQLLDRIAYLKNELAKLLGKGSANVCPALNNNLYLGMANNDDVRCLQQFLKNQGPDIYSSGLVTGNFGSLTKQAVAKFQAKYAIAATGFVGPATRNKINQILNGG